MGNKITDAVHRYYWQHNYNCARTCLLTLGELFELPIEQPRCFVSSIKLKLDFSSNLPL